jgi:hypothetical protein
VRDFAPLWTGLEIWLLGFSLIFSGRRLHELIEKRCNHYRQIVACMLSGASRDRPVVVGWSTLRRADWVHEGARPYSDPVPGCYLTRTQFLWGVARGHAAAGLSLMGLVNEGSSCGRPAHDHWMISRSCAVGYRGALVLRWKLLTPLDPQDRTPSCHRTRLPHSYLAPPPASSGLRAQRAPA